MPTRAESAETGLLCPVCQQTLVMSERQSIEIDYCPKCRGVWLDRGELDKIIERSMGTDGGPEAGAATDRAGSKHAGSKHGSGHGGSHGGGLFGGHGGGHGGGRGRGHGGRGSWLRDLFD